MIRALRSRCFVAIGNENMRYEIAPSSASWFRQALYGNRSYLGINAKRDGVLNTSTVGIVSVEPLYQRKLHS